MNVGFLFENMSTVYVIESLKDGIWYTGIAMDATLRLKEHNAGRNRFTKGHMPWKIIFTEVHQTWAQARLREKYLKSNAGKLWLRKFLQGNGGKTGSLPA
jgi:putative endonuclease